MTAITAYTVTSPQSGKILSVYPTRRRAESMADRIGADVREREVTVGESVTFTFHGHIRRGTVVGGKGGQVEVEFHQGTTGKIVRRMSVENVTF